jgi:hypothetical protein
MLALKRTGRGERRDEVRAVRDAMNPTRPSGGPCRLLRGMAAPRARRPSRGARSRPGRGLLAPGDRPAPDRTADVSQGAAAFPPEASSLARRPGRSSWPPGWTGRGSASPTCARTASTPRSPRVPRPGPRSVSSSPGSRARARARRSVSSGLAAGPPRDSSTRSTAARCCATSCTRTTRSRPSAWPAACSCSSASRSAAAPRCGPLTSTPTPRGGRRSRSAGRARGRSPRRRSGDQGDAGLGGRMLTEDRARPMAQPRRSESWPRSVAPTRARTAAAVRAVIAAPIVINHVA